MNLTELNASFQPTLTKSSTFCAPVIVRVPCESRARRESKRYPRDQAGKDRPVAVPAERENAAGYRDGAGRHGPETGGTDKPFLPLLSLLSRVAQQFP